ncbi:nitroreductase [Chloroflexota bacterium]
MDILDAIRTRKSIRGYKPNPVPREVLNEILDIARHAPSGMNTQPWEVIVITGDVLANISRENIEKLTSGAKPNRDVPPHTREGIYRQRQIDVAVQLFGLLGIAREDKEKRDAWMQHGFRFFNAPAALIITMDKSCQESHFNIGTIAQTICLAALNYGLGTCIQDQGTSFPDVVRKYAKIPESKLIINCITIGFPDWDFPANKLETTREPVENFVTWRGFG